MPFPKIDFCTRNSFIFDYAVMAIERAGFNVEPLKAVNTSQIEVDGICIRCEPNGTVSTTTLVHRSAQQVFQSMSYQHIDRLDELISTLKSYKPAISVGEWTYVPTLDLFVNRRNPDFQITPQAITRLYEFSQLVKEPPCPSGSTSSSVQ